jgi:hypothetical protein
MGGEKANREHRMTIFTQALRMQAIVVKDKTEVEDSTSYRSQLAR